MGTRGASGDRCSVVIGVRTPLATGAALIGFAANSLLCRAALGGRAIDAWSFTAVRIGSGALALALLARMGSAAPASVRGTDLEEWLFTASTNPSHTSSRIGPRDTQATSEIEETSMNRLTTLTVLMTLTCHGPTLAAAQIGSVAAKQKISETAGGFGGVLDPSEQFGESMNVLGDLDGDGVVDLAIGVPQDADGGSSKGAVWIVFLDADGTVKTQQKISSTAGGFGGTLALQDNFGKSVSPLGDLDGDGTIDIAVGAYLDDDGGLSQGAVWILFLNPNGTVKAHQKISETAGGFGGVLDPGDYFGYSATALGDLDGDGVPDLAVGAVLDASGATWVLFLNANGTVKGQQKISATEGGFGGTLGGSDEFGASLAYLGDLDGDGVGDLAVGADSDDTGGANQGTVWILFLNTNGTVKTQQEISESTGGFGGALDPGDGFGIAVSALEDLDSDGVRDLAVGALFDGDGGFEQGAVWILFLNPNGTVKAHQKISETAGGLGNVLDPGDNFGRAVSSLGDLDGDGNGDLAVTARNDDDGGTNQGAAWILFLQGPDTTPPILSCPPVVAIDAKGGPPGETVFFSVTVTDDTDPAPSVVCVPPSGSSFPRGTTLVNCTATDASGNQSVCMFPVIVTPTVAQRQL